MIPGGYGKDSKTIKYDSGSNGNPANAYPKEKQAARVQNDELGYRQIIQFSRS